MTIQSGGLSLHEQTRLINRWFDSNTTSLSGLRPEPGDLLDARIAKGAALMARLYADGIGGLGWPEAMGGSGGDARSRAVLYDGLTVRGFELPEHVAALEVLGPALVGFAPRLAAAYLPDLLAGRTLWCQGFSEPDAGSDLAALRTTARKSPEGWRISGQKVWTSLGHRARWCAVLARTGTPESRHRGLTLFWNDLQADGVVVRPLRALTGHEEFSEIFFDEVLVPADHIVGEPDGGWAVAMSLLQYERGMWAWQRQARMHTALSGLVGSRHGVDYEALVGDAYVRLCAVRMRSRRTVERLAAGAVLGAEASIDKVLLSAAEQAVQDAVRQTDPGWFAVSDDAAAEHARSEWFYSRAASIYGGSVEIQRNLIAELILGLPKERKGG